MTTKGRRRGKDLERFVARLFDGRRIGLLGHEDVETELFVIEAKERGKSFPKSLKKWMAQAEANAKGKIPMLYLHEHGKSHEEDIMCVRLGGVR